MRIGFWLSTASLILSVSVLRAETKSESLEAFHVVSADAIKKCQDQSMSSLKKAEEAVNFALYKQRLQMDSRASLRRYGMPDKIKQLDSEMDAEREAFIAKQDGMELEHSTAANDCAKSAAAEIKGAFPKANDIIKKKAPLSGMLKDYFANALTAANGSIPATNEKSAEYKKRQEEATTKLNDLWNRVDVEASY